MIKTEKEYLWAKEKLKEEAKAIKECRNRLKKVGLPANHIKMALDPLISFRLGLKEEVEAYEKSKKNS